MDTNRNRQHGKMAYCGSKWRKFDRSKVFGRSLKVGKMPSNVFEITASLRQ